MGRARRDLHRRIPGQHLRRTRSSALRRTLLAALLSLCDPAERLVLVEDAAELHRAIAASVRDPGPMLIEAMLC